MRFYIVLIIRLIVLLICFLYFKTNYKKTIIFLIFCGCFIAEEISISLPYEYRMMDWGIKFLSLFCAYYFSYNHKKKINKSE